MKRISPNPRFFLALAAIALMALTNFSLNEFLQDGVSVIISLI
jgi:hypothetical protein